jgi:hypothetical protein
MHKEVEADVAIRNIDLDERLALAEVAAKLGSHGDAGSHAVSSNGIQSICRRRYKIGVLIVDLGSFFQVKLCMTPFGISLNRQRFSSFDVMFQARLQILGEGNTASFISQLTLSRRAGNQLLEHRHVSTILL